MSENTSELFQEFPNSYRGVRLVEDLLDVLGEKQFGSQRGAIERKEDKVTDLIYCLFPGIWINKILGYSYFSFIEELTLYCIILPEPYHEFVVLYFLTKYEKKYLPSIYNFLLKQIRIRLGSYIDVSTKTPTLGESIQDLFSSKYLTLYHENEKEKSNIIKTN